MKALIALAFLAAVSPAFAQDSDGPRKKAAMDKLQSEMTACIVYYSIVKDCADSNDPAMKHTDPIVDQLTGRSFSIGKSIGMSSDSMLARLKLMMDEQDTLMGKSCANVASLHQRHASRCKQIVENPNAILSEYLKQ